MKTTSDASPLDALGPAVRRIAIVALFALAGVLQLEVLPFERLTAEYPGPAILFGNDTVAHDIPVQYWMWREVARGGGEMPLWMPTLQGGLPSLGAFLWTPFAPTLWLHAFLPFPLAQRLQFLLALIWAGLGGYWAARQLGIRREAALITGLAYGFCGHVVTLIHAGHLQKILALAWVAWAAGGLIAAFAPRETPARIRLRGAAIAGFSVGMAFLAGHPQIAYSVVLLAGLRFVWTILAEQWWRAGLWRARWPLIGVMISIPVLGGLVGAAQLIPGMEMGALSNRAEGVAFEEATNTSYPPLEVLEFVLPRFLGDSVGMDVGHETYLGGWGERLVSDYASIVLVSFAILALFAASCRREVLFWWLVAVLFLVVGFGQNTPLYRLLYEFLPGMSRFRSPGTFYVLVAVSLPVLGALGADFFAPHIVKMARERAALLVGLAVGLLALGLGMGFMAGKSAPPGSFTLEALERGALIMGLVAAGILAVRSIRRERLAAGLFLLGIALVVGGDLLAANRYFLIKLAWNHYETHYVAPNEIDLAMVDEPAPRRVLEVDRETALRPLFNDRDALLGYHPIGFAVFEEQLRRAGAGSPAWRAHWGVRHGWAAEASRIPEGFEVEGQFRSQPGGLWLVDRKASKPVRFESGGPSRLLSYSWAERTPNRAALEFEAPGAGALVLAENAAPGWQYSLDGGPWTRETAPRIERRVEVEGAGTHAVVWEYRPDSYRMGLFLTVVGLGLFAGLFMASAGRSGKREVGKAGCARPR